MGQQFNRREKRQRTEARLKRQKKALKLKKASQSTGQTVSTAA